MTTPVHNTPLVDYVLRRGDDALILGQRLSAWTGHAPIIEEDLALTNVALDLVGQAQLWLAYAGEVEARGRDADQLAYLRDTRDFRNVLLVELPNGDYGKTLARQFLFDTWHFYFLSALGASTDHRLAGIAQKAVREVAYHLRRSGEWVVRLGDGTQLSHAKMQTALDELWPYTGELFVSDDVDREMAHCGIGPLPEALREPWLVHVARICTDATLELPEPAWMQSGGKAGRHTEHLGYLLAEMQSVRRSVAGEHW